MNNTSYTSQRANNPIYPYLPTLQIHGRSPQLIHKDLWKTQIETYGLHTYHNLLSTFALIQKLMEKIT